MKYSKEGHKTLHYCCSLNFKKQAESAEKGTTFTSKLRSLTVLQITIVNAIHNHIHTLLDLQLPCSFI